MRRGTGLYLFKCAFSAILFLIATFIHPLSSSASGTLEFPKDLINSSVDGQSGVNHDVSFVLPSDSPQITPTDWIEITFTHFNFVTAPTDIVGGYGNPIFSVSGNTARVTNIALLPGTGLEIIGITAQNPQFGQTHDVVMSVAVGAANGLIRNQVITVAGVEGSYISITATVQSPYSAINISGFTGPNSFTTLTENGTSIGTTTSAGDGTFLFSISGLDPGDHTYQISSSDSTGRNTSQTTLHLFLVQSTVTSASGIFLSPTIQIDKSQLNPGETLTASGTARPTSQINVFTESPLKSYTATSDASGNWSYTIPGSETQNYAPGQYRIYTNVQDNGGNQSIVSPTLNFTVLSPTNGANPPPACDISHGDLNCDTKTNLIDFSILLFHWHTNHKVADINADGLVNLVDFSIMMFYFRR